MFSDTPLPPEEPTGQNPPDGAILDYQLNKNAKKVKLEIIDSQNNVIRTYSSDDEPEVIDSTSLAHPTYWIRPQQSLGITQGHHRFEWDLRHEPPRGTRRQFSIAAVYKNTPSGPHGPFVQPGTYRVKLTVAGKSVERPITIKMDPRVDISARALQMQTELSKACYDAYHELEIIKEIIDGQRSPSSAQTALRGNGSVGDPDTMYGSISHVTAGQETLVGLQQKFLFMMNLIQAADVQPTSQTVKAIETLNNTLDGLKAKWDKVKK